MSLSLDDFSLAKRWEPPVIFISNLNKDYDLIASFYNNFIQARGSLYPGEHFNNLSPAALDKARNIYRPLLEEKAIKSWV